MDDCRYAYRSAGLSRQKQARLAIEEKADTRRQKTLERELEWIRMSPRARQAKGKARLTAYENLLSQESEVRRENLPGGHGRQLIKQAVQFLGRGVRS